MDYIEIEIPVPWGIIAAKTCGNDKNPLVLCGHGWTDNSSTFDVLLPFLPKSFYYVCVDLPGHGKSSALGALILTKMDYIIVFKLLYNFFKRDKITIIGHSISALTGILFAQFYGDCIDKLITFDVLYYFPKPPNMMFSTLMDVQNEKIRHMEKQTKTPTFTKEEAIERKIFGRRNPLSKKVAEILVERTLQPTKDGKYEINFAPDAKIMMMSHFSVENTVDIFKKFPVKCPHLLLLSSESSFIMYPFRNLIEEYKKNPNFELHVIKGNHDFNLSRPMPVGALVSDFLLKHNNKL